MRRSDRFSKQAEAWRKMLSALCEFKNQHGGCEVPALYEKNPRLGRWVAAQRHKRKCGSLPDERLKALEEVGFNWAPGGAAWNQMFKKLCDFKTLHGHCDVPQDRNGHRDLSAWVQHQRIRQRKGVLEPERSQRLEKLGFSWFVGRGNRKRLVLESLNEIPCPFESAEKLYALGHGAYVQHDGKGQKDQALDQYVKKHNGEYPPFIPLPNKPIVFVLGHRPVHPVEVKWKGHGPLPDKVVDFVCQNGTLPPYG